VITITNKNTKLEEPVAMTIGKFDGLHLGHLLLIKKTVSYARSLGIPSLVFTFNPSPLTVFAKAPVLPLMPEDEKSAVLHDLGVDILFNYPFTRAFSQKSPESFCKFIFEDLFCKVLVIGKNFRFGRNRAGNAALLKHVGKRHGALVDIIENVWLYGEPVSSTRIRNAIESGNLLLAEELLGHSLSYDGGTYGRT
jgi:riboflavin kinase/FMN adenylyltransferase